MGPPPVIAAVGAALAGAPDAIEARLEALSLDEQVALLVMAPPALSGARGSGHLLLDARALADPRSVRVSVEALAGATSIPMLVAANVEGGSVNALHGLPALRDLPSAQTLARLPDAADHDG